MSTPEHAAKLSVKLQEWLDTIDQNEYPATMIAGALIGAGVCTLRACEVDDIRIRAAVDHILDTLPGGVKAHA